MYRNACTESAEDHKVETFGNDDVYVAEACGLHDDNAKPKS